MNKGKLNDWVSSVITREFTEKTEPVVTSDILTYILH